MDTDWPRLLDAYARAERAAGHRPETIRTRLSYLRRWAETGPVETNAQRMADWLAYPTWAPSTRKGARQALRSFYCWARIAGIIEADPTVGLPTVRVPRNLPRPASEEQVEAGKAAADPDTVLMVALAAHAGLRRSEIARVRREDLGPFGLRVEGKGGRVRMVRLLPWLRLMVEARPAGWLFPGRFSGHMHPATVQRHVREAAGCSPHPLRHRFATRAYQGTRNVFAVQQLLGHQSAETTQVYVRIADEALWDAVLAAA